MSRESLSIVVPLFNEEENVAPLCASLLQVLPGLGRKFEIVLIDDGSHDGTAAAARRIAAAEPNIRLISLLRNYGQTAAVMAGIDHATGDVIVTMDGDLQNDPADIPALLAKLEEGFDVVSGWRKDRRDPALTRRLPSIAANWLISWISGVRLRDYGCTLKAYRRSVIKGVRLYGEMHRFVPIYCKWQGGRVAEIPVRHGPRLHGSSHYGLERILKVILDIMVVTFLDRYATRPIHLFGIFGLLMILLGMIAGAGAVYYKVFDDIHFIRTPLPLLAVFCFVTGLTSILLGLLAELVMRTYFESQGKRVYMVRNDEGRE